MKKRNKTSNKVKLNKETIRRLSDKTLNDIVGGTPTWGGGVCETGPILCG